MSFSYQELRALMSVISTVIITVPYAVLMFQRYPQTDAYSPEIFRFWGVFFILLIFVSIVAKIALTILFSILNAVITREADGDRTDERDRQIEQKSTQYALYVFSAGFLLAMAALAVDQPPVVMFVILLGAGMLSEVVSDFAKFFFYRRGF